MRRSWRLNERHYGDLQGKDKKETAEKFGEEKLLQWRRSYDVPPPPLEWDASMDPRYADLPTELIPRSECLKDVVERMLPYWYDGIVPDLAAGRVTLVAAHGNSLRGLVKHLDGMTPDEIVKFNIGTGQPLVYELDDQFQVKESRYLDPAAARPRPKRSPSRRGDDRRGGRGPAERGPRRLRTAYADGTKFLDRVALYRYQTPNVRFPGVGAGPSWTCTTATGSWTSGAVPASMSASSPSDRSDSTSVAVDQSPGHGAGGGRRDRG